MPRQGPRPFECVRRAWHSDKHHPMRGSLIQEIFRIVNDVHCPATRKNREWQEKLPIVVLRAEEIMYSKANSEAEYSDLRTLWERVNNAIDTIIRRDKSTETGELLQPCIEAALLLGCTPRRTSRSQCNDSPRCYLRPQIPGDTSISPSSDNFAINNPHIIRHAQYVTPNTENSMYSCLKFDNYSIRDLNYNDEKFHVLPKEYAPSDNHHISAETLAAVNACSVYPLYNNYQIQPRSSNCHSKKPSNSSSCLMDVDKLVATRNLSPDELDCSSFIHPPNHNYNSDKGYGVKCDLTLRLGSLVVPCARIERSWKQV
ncbi:hypothetical protein F511_14415 [Dorcoceras hygrometricum]|uniref:Histone acetyltransferase n=1 Tax=Dorcoceras hygrometricum TaxID=472368 RepID=A0A2Z7CSB3_9LAMI|nr:hypothetical protein F511_14415 [Dorcoceras hygrometricum]